MRKILILIFLLIPFSIFAKDYASVAVKIDPKEGIIKGVLDIREKSTEFTFDLKNADFNDGNTFVLYRKWMPEIPRDMGLRMYVFIPDEYMYVTESDRSQVTRGGIRYEFENPDEGVAIAFSDQWIKETVEHKGVDISTFFTKTNSVYSKRYFEKIKELLDLYTLKLGKYPYGSFSVVDVPYPAGHALKSLTFISSRIIGMPFLTETSLGHELVHQWFGVGIKADVNEGNWAEGLTTYMADRLYAEMKGEGADYRKNAIKNYMAHARQKEDGTCLMEFKYNSSKQQQAIGYSKAMMVFSMLEAMVGMKDFEKGIRIFVHRYMGKTASWDDIIATLEDVSGVYLKDFLDGWLADTAIVEFSVTPPAVKAELNGYSTSFEIKSKYEWLEYPLEVKVVTEDGKEQFEYLYIKDKVKKVRIETESRPAKIIIDPEYKSARLLSDGEMTPVLYHLFSKYKKVIFINPEDRAVYAPFLMTYKDIEVVSADANPSLYMDRIMIFAGNNNKAFRKLYGDAPAFGGEFMVKAYKHPMGSDRMSYLLISSDMKSTSSNIRRIKHYGKYSSLVLDTGRSYEKNIEESDKGLIIDTSKRKTGVRVSAPLSIKEIVEENSDTRVFIIGESHDKFAHHDNQLAFIKALAEKGRHVAIGLEMFQKPYQDYLDGYISGEVSQADMLRDTEYYDRWRFDFRLYKPIFDYALKNNIPMVAMNAQQELTKKISAGGIMSLSASDMAKVPEIEYTGGKYKEFLKKVFSMHAGKRKFEHFYEAQLLWDETMADSAAIYMHEHPGKTLVILAGNGHVRFRHGIADRFERRTGIKPVTVLQDEDYEEGISDYILYPDEIEYTASPKVGVMVDETDNGLQVKEVVHGKYADKAGVEKGDYIIEFNGYRVDDLSGIRIALLYAELGKTYKMKILRDGKELELSVAF